MLICIETLCTSFSNPCPKQNIWKKKVSQKRVTAFESKAEQAEQNNRRNCLRISGVEGMGEENTDYIVLSLAQGIDSYDWRMLIGAVVLIILKKRRTNTREIIVNFATTTLVPTSLNNEPSWKRDVMQANLLMRTSQKSEMNTFMKLPRWYK